MRTQTLGDKRDFIAARVRNAEATATIPRGTPVALVLNATEDGLAVVLPSTAGAAKCTAVRFGVALDDILAGQLGEVQSYGLCNYVILVVNSRANTSGGSSFSSKDTLALLVALSIDTVNNAFSTKASTTAFASTDAFSLSAFQDNGAVLAQTVASLAAIATSTNETRSVITQAVKAFLRMM